MTSAAAHIWPVVPQPAPLFEALCECGRHFTADTEPQICPRCHSLRLTVQRITHQHDHPTEGDL